jgi:3-deoxy-manno-octulosonate cytidylyltransferase (CMP-KDO synthetase)
MKNKIAGIIPARYASTRFPGKPLADILGKSMICRVYEQASAASSLSEVWVATDDQRIYNHVADFGGKVMMTSTSHRTGTERCMETVNMLEKDGKHFDVVINIQGDEPFIDPLQIDKVAGCFIRPEVDIATLMKEIGSNDELFSPNIIKVVADHNGKAIYFSRSPIPYLRGKDESEWTNVHKYFKHIGIYAFRTEILKKVTKLTPTPLETAESLEQLRWIENGYAIHIEETQSESHSVDTPEDLDKIKAL